MDVDRLLAQGLEFYLDGRLREAAAAWDEVLRLDPQNARAREYLKSALSAHGPRVGELTPGPGAKVELTPGRRGFKAVSVRAERTPAPAAEASPWDDGPTAAPSVTLEPKGIDLDLVDGPQNTPVRRPFAADGALSEADRAEVANLLRGARELYALNDFSGALELLERVRLKDPRNPGVERMREDCIETLTHMFESQIGPLSGVPRLAVNPDEIIWLNLDHRAGFVLAQIDGSVTYDDLYAICGMSRLDTARILAQLLQEKVVRTAG